MPRNIIDMSGKVVLITRPPTRPRMRSTANKEGAAIKNGRRLGRNHEIRSPHA